MNIQFLSFITALLCLYDLQGQYNNQTLFPGETGSNLLTDLINNYKTNTVLSYTDARIKMYKEIYNVHDSVYCVYSKHVLYLDPQYPNPIDYLVKGGSNNGINCEHTFPQSKGAEIGNARSDMHHLFPSRAAVNEARSNYPFGEIDDSKTKSWFYRTSEINIKPKDQITEYSEGITNLFEPREDHKGNVARAIFYFYSMYESQSDKTFFESMLPSLCEWHNYDPVDSIEWARTQQIAHYQENKANPFVLDCSLPQRSYCPLQTPCILNNSNQYNLNSRIEVFPNPVSDRFTIRLSNLSSKLKEIEITNNLGICVYTISSINDNQKFTIPSLDWKAGTYCIKFIWQSGFTSFKKVIKI